MNHACIPAWVIVYCIDYQYITQHGRIASVSYTYILTRGQMLPGCSILEAFYANYGLSAWCQSFVTSTLTGKKSITDGNITSVGLCHMCHGPQMKHRSNAKYDM